MNRISVPLSSFVKPKGRICFYLFHVLEINDSASTKQKKQTSDSAAAEIVCVGPGHLFFNGFPLTAISRTSLEQLEVTLGCTCKVFVSIRRAVAAGTKRVHIEKQTSLHFFSQHAQAVDSFLIKAHVT